MDLLIRNETRVRQDEALESARSRRLARLASRGRSRSFRHGAARAAQTLSDALGALARALHNGETATN
jgi:hypothetical protein